MATPSVLTVPSMYGDGILYSGPSAYGSEIASQPVDLQTDFVNNSGGVIVDANTFTSSGGSLDGVRSKDSSFTLPVGTAFEIEIRGTTTSNGITLGDFGGGGNEYGSGFGVHRFVSLNNRLFIRQRDSAGTTTITHLSIRPLTQGSDFDFTRATTGTRINEEGYIEDVPYNLISYSEDFTNWSQTRNIVTANTIIAPDNTLTADKIAVNSTFSSNTSRVLQNITSTNANTFSVFAKADEITEMLIYAQGSNNGVYFNLSNASFINYSSGATNISSYNIENYNNGWNRFSITFSVSNTRIEIYLSKNGTAITDFTIGEGFYLWGAQLIKGEQLKNYLPTTDRLNLPRLNCPTYGGCPSLLVEPQRTNLVSKSNDVTTGGGNTLINLQINSSNNLSPEGINNAQEIEVTATGQPRIESVTTSNTTIYSVSCYVKKVTGDFFGLGFYQQDIGNQYAKFDLDKGTFVAVESDGVVSKSATNIYNCEIIAYKNNWYRITCNILTGAAASKSAIKWLAMSASSFSNGVVGDKFLIYGRQVEQASYVTSLIHTSGSTETRNEDKAVNSGLGTTDTFNDSEGVLFIETEALFNNNEARGISINAGNIGNRVLISYPSAGDSSINGYLQTSAGSNSSMIITGVDTTQKHKVAIKYKLNDTSLFIDGVKRAVDTNVGTPVGLDRLHFSNGVSANTAKYKGNLNAIAVYKTALTDTELANLTLYNNHDLFIPYRSRMQMISADQELQCTEHDITRFL